MTDMAVLNPTHRLIPRWEGHGNLTVHVVDGHVYLRADQVEQLAGIPPWTGGETLVDEEWFEVDGHPCYSVEDAVARCEAHATDTAAAFLAWLDTTLEGLLADDVLELAHKPVGFTTSYTVSRAAKVLSRDPAIEIGMHGLFDHMRAQGWIHRDHPHSDWQLSKGTGPVMAGWLTIREVLVPAAGKIRRRMYSQIYITPHGLEQLRRTLHALNESPPPDTPAPTLF